MTANLRPVPPIAAATQQPLVQALNLSTTPNAMDEQTRTLAQQALDQAQQGGFDLQNGQTAALFSNLDIDIRTQLLQALNLSQQELSQNQARLQVCTLIYVSSKLC